MLTSCRTTEIQIFKLFQRESLEFLLGFGGGFLAAAPEHTNLHAMCKYSPEGHRSHQLQEIQDYNSTVA